MSRAVNAIAAGLFAVALLPHALLADPTEPGAPQTSTPAVASDWSGLSFGFALATPGGDNAWRQASDGLELVPAPWTGSALVVGLGHDWQKNRLTYGVHLGYGNGAYRALPEDAAFINCSTCATQTKDLLTLTGQVGFDAGQTRLFASGGIARGNVAATDRAGITLVAEDGMMGWTVGVGMETRIGDGLSLSVSYDHVDLGTLPLPSFLPTAETDVALDRMQVGMNVRW